MMTYLQKAIKVHDPKNWSQLKGCILEAGARRIRPLVMTTTIMWSTSTGSEVMIPMAIPTLGGMLVELNSLFMVPIVFAYFEKRKITHQAV